MIFSISASQARSLASYRSRTLRWPLNSLSFLTAYPMGCGTGRVSDVEVRVTDLSRGDEETFQAGASRRRDAEGEMPEMRCRLQESPSSTSARHGNPTGLVCTIFPHHRSGGEGGNGYSLLQNGPFLKRVRRIRWRALSSRGRGRWQEPMPGIDARNGGRRRFYRAIRHNLSSHLSLNGMAPSARSQADRIGLPSYLPPEEGSPSKTVDAIREGTPAEALGWLKERLELTAEELSGVIHVSRRTMSRRLGVTTSRMESLKQQAAGESQHSPLRVHFCFSQGTRPRLRAANSFMENRSGRVDVPHRGSRLILMDLVLFYCP